MLALWLVLLLALSSAVHAETGIASHYSTKDRDQNGKTACGPRLRDHRLTMAHRRLPCGTRVRVTNHNNGRSVLVTVTDRGPFVRGRVADLSLGAARAIGLSGSARISLARSR
jgi:rare lipoprotein A